MIDVKMSGVAVGNVFIRAGRFSGGVPSPVTPEHGGAIIFEMGDGTEAIRFSPDGKVYVRGELVHDNLQTWTAMSDWLTHALIVSGGRPPVAS